MYHTLWVCASRKEANAREKTFGNPANVLFIRVGDTLGGRRFNEVIIDNMYADAGDSKTMYEHITRWFDDCVRCRLVPKGTIKSLTGSLRWKL